MRRICTTICNRLRGQCLYRAYILAKENSRVDKTTPASNKMCRNCFHSPCSTSSLQHKNQQSTYYYRHSAFFYFWLVAPQSHLLCMWKKYIQTNAKHMSCELWVSYNDISVPCSMQLTLHLSSLIMKQQNLNIKNSNNFADQSANYPIQKTPQLNKVLTHIAISTLLISNMQNTCFFSCHQKSPTYSEQNVSYTPIHMLPTKTQ